MQKCNCPSCGAPVIFQSAASILAVCEYCASTLIRHDLDLEDLGKMAALLVDGSPLQLRAEGQYRRAHFSVVGRIQLRYEKGIWNEWHLLFDDLRSGWLGESGGIYTVSFLTAVKEVIPRFKDLNAGSRVILNDQPYEVTQLQKTFCVAGEGELPFAVGPGYEAPEADLAGPENMLATLDYSEEIPLVFLGEYVEFEQLHLSGLREFDGW
jgi:hypothetical protein